MNISEIKQQIAALEAQQRKARFIDRPRIDSELTAMRNRLRNTIDSQDKQRRMGHVNALIAQAPALLAEKEQQAEQQAITAAETAVMESAKAAYARTNGSEVGFDEAWPKIRQQMAIQSAHTAAQQTQQQQDRGPEQRRVAL